MPKVLIQFFSSLEMLIIYSIYIGLQKREREGKRERRERERKKEEREVQIINKKSKREIKEEKKSVDLASCKRNTGIEKPSSFQGVFC